VIILLILSLLNHIKNSDSDDGNELMKKIKAKDQKALAELYDLYGHLLYGLIFSILKKRTEAEDLLQEVFVNVWEKATSFDPERGNAYQWLVTLTRNKAIDRIRSKNYKSQKKEETDIELPDIPLTGDQRSPLESTILKERAEKVKKALLEIPEKQRQVIQIAYFRGLSQSEIAKHLDIPLGTVKTRTRQGMLKLKELLSNNL